jgi:predicted SnoaL-like aldol condensation-catalyzing enzyme
LIKNAPPTLRYEHGVILADKELVIVHGRFSGHGRPSGWIAADIVRITDGVVAKHWDVSQDEATPESRKAACGCSARPFLLVGWDLTSAP